MHGPGSPLARAWGRNMRQHRLETGYSQTELAHRLGISQASIGRYEQGLQVPAAHRRFAIAAVLNADVRALFPSMSADTLADYPETR